MQTVEASPPDAVNKYGKRMFNLFTFCLECLNLFLSRRLEKRLAWKHSLRYGRKSYGRTGRGWMFVSRTEFPSSL
ncbi:Hypothetical predicted protein [Podarcis lilfordi]|uniref:Uncharacterized protein n=1 Tax=Podarcis lilfordi TaxID=74358 RepID=A0AA35NUM2_9SAUR|nr:Hypothetical predicted protein [Podarcis lilfordi]